MEEKRIILLTGAPSGINAYCARHDYPVTLPAMVGFLLERIRPSAPFYRMVARQG